MARTAAERRHHARRVKRNRKTYHNAGCKSVHAIGKAARTPCLCSCWMCGNRSRLLALRAAAKRANTACKGIAAGRLDIEAPEVVRALPTDHYW